jgi:hypothetical protein
MPRFFYLHLNQLVSWEEAVLLDKKLYLLQTDLDVKLKLW